MTCGSNLCTLRRLLYTVRCCCSKGLKCLTDFMRLIPSRLSNVMFLGYLSSLLNKWPLLMRGFRDTWHDQRRKYFPFIFYDWDIYLHFHWLVAGVKPLNRRYKYTMRAGAHMHIFIKTPSGSKCCTLLIPHTNY